MNPFVTRRRTSNNMIEPTTKKASRSAALLLLIFAAAASANSQTVPNVSPTPSTPITAPTQYAFPTAKTRFKRYANEMFGPTALAKSAFSAGFFTWRNSPEEWGPTWRGAAKRFGSGVAKTFIRSTVTYSLEESFQLDSHFYKSTNRGAGAKISNALLSPVTARNRNGKRVFGFPRVIGTYAAAETAVIWWYPARYDWKDGLKSGTISLGMSAGFNLIKEFLRK